VLIASRRIEFLVLNLIHVLLVTGGDIFVTLLSYSFGDLYFRVSVSAACRRAFVDVGN
jgi:hypothetical protein